MSAAARTLLIADDSITIQKVVDLTFRDEGFSVTTVSNGTAAIEIIERTKPDIVLLDAQMPKPDGYEVCRRIKRDEKLRHIPVLLLINSFEPYNEAEARRAGANDTLTKPFQSIRELVNKVSGLLSPARSSDEAAETKPIDEADSNRTREEVHEPEAVSPTPPPRAFEFEKIAAEEEQSDDDDGMIQVAELGAPHSQHSQSAPYNDALEMPEPPPVASPLDAALYFDAPLTPASGEPREMNAVDDSSTAHETYRGDDLLQLDTSTPENFSHRKSNDAAINTKHTTELNTAMTPHDEPHHSSNDFNDKPHTDNPFDDNLFADEQSATSEPTNQPVYESVSEDAFPLILADDAPLDLGETQTTPLNNSDDAILDFGDDAPPAVTANTDEQFPSAMIDRDSFEFADDVEVTNIETMKVEEVAPAAHETNEADSAFAANAFPPEFIEYISRQVVAHLSQNVLREVAREVALEVAWEVVPQLAERLIKQRLDEDVK